MALEGIRSFAPWRVIKGSSHLTCCFVCSICVPKSCRSSGSEILSATFGNTRRLCFSASSNLARVWVYRFSSKSSFIVQSSSTTVGRTSILESQDGSCALFADRITTQRTKPQGLPLDEPPELEEPLDPLEPLEGLFVALELPLLPPELLPPELPLLEPLLPPELLPPELLLPP